uniref:Uncharacterized protein n=1 Tax=Anopheles dirus TaxID=7168 RepID=A0A182NPY4_9DIPT
MRITHHPGRAVDASLSLEQRSAMGALYEANWNKVQSSMNALIESHHETAPYEPVAQSTGRPANLESYRKSAVAGSSEDDEGLPDEEERDTFQESSGVMKALNGYRPATIRRARQRQFPEWDELKDPKDFPEDSSATKYHTVRGRMFENTHKPRPALRGSSMAEFDAGHYANLLPSSDAPQVPARNSTLKRSNTVAAQTPAAQQRTLDRRELFLHQHQQHQYQPQQQQKKERVRQQKPMDEYSDHLHRPVSHHPEPMSDLVGSVDRLDSKLRSSSNCDNAGGSRYRDKSSPADYRRGSDDSESNLSIGDRMTSYRSDNDLCTQIYREGSRNGSLASIPRATATLSRNRTIKGRPILEDIPADLLPRIEPEKPKRSGKKVGFGKMLYNTISAGTKFPRTLLKSHFGGAGSREDTSEYDSANGYQDSPLSSMSSSSASSSFSASPPSSSKSSFKKLFGGGGGGTGSGSAGGSRSTSNSSNASNGPTSPANVYHQHQQRRGQFCDDVSDTYIIASRHGPSSGVGGKYSSLVPVHTYARKRRTGNLIANEPIYGNVEEIYANPDGLLDSRRGTVFAQ